MKFDGATFVAERDELRLTPQFEAVKSIMLDNNWHTIPELKELLTAGGISATEPAISARIRDLRKIRFGGYTVIREYITNGLWQYKLITQTKL